MQRLSTKDNPEALRLIRAADPSYRKHQFTLTASETVCLSNTYWDGGSRSTYTAIDLITGRNKGAPQFDPPEFGGPKTAPIVSIPEGIAIVETGVFMGKPATAHIFVNPANMAKFISA